ncbi:hypothetical protein F4776DRAFT_634351 [Hypoxylon sp. NC0597]|nr:hypothetical protein F4776DRAFT_634351 [Hypoxylon sp. NC0597]
MRLRSISSLRRKYMAYAWLYGLYHIRISAYPFFLFWHRCMNGPPHGMWYLGMYYCTLRLPSVSCILHNNRIYV